MKDIVTLEQAFELVDKGYLDYLNNLTVEDNLEADKYYWDRHNPQPLNGAQIAWRLSERKGKKLDSTCCLPAPTLLHYTEYMDKL